MKKIRFVKSKLKNWNIVSFEDLKRKRTFLQTLLALMLVNSKEFDFKTFSNEGIKESGTRKFVKGRGVLEAKG